MNCGSIWWCSAYGRCRKVAGNTVGINSSKYTKVSLKRGPDWNDRKMTNSDKSRKSNATTETRLRECVFVWVEGSPTREKRLLSKRGIGRLMTILNRPVSKGVVVMVWFPMAICYVVLYCIELYARTKMYARTMLYPSLCRWAGQGQVGSKKTRIRN